MPSAMIFFQHSTGDPRQYKGGKVIKDWSKRNKQDCHYSQFV